MPHVIRPRSTTRAAHHRRGARPRARVIHYFVARGRGEWRSASAADSAFDEARAPLLMRIPELPERMRRSVRKTPPHHVRPPTRRPWRCYPIPSPRACPVFDPQGSCCSAVAATSRGAPEDAPARRSRVRARRAARRDGRHERRDRNAWPDQVRVPLRVVPSRPVEKNSPDWIRAAQFAARRIAYASPHQHLARNRVTPRPPPLEPANRSRSARHLFSDPSPSTSPPHH